jgi:hypothetical protein
MYQLATTGMDNLVLDASDKMPFFIPKKNGEFQFGGINARGCRILLL